MREWVAEETGQEQLDFYTLQAGTNPQDRWWVHFECCRFTTDSSNPRAGFIRCFDGLG